MPKKVNPLNLNALQLKTLTLLQELAVVVGSPSAEDPGAVRIDSLPHPHGNHFHVGDATVMTRDATGLANESAWVALARKGLIRSEFPNAAVLLPSGVAYETGLRDKILMRSDH